MVSLTAIGSGYYVVTVNGVEFSRHTTEREAIEVAVNEEQKAHGLDVRYRHEYTVRVEDDVIPVLADSGTTTGESEVISPSNNPPVWSLPSTISVQAGVVTSINLVASGYLTDSDGPVAPVVSLFSGSLPAGWSLTSAGILNFDGRITPFQASFVTLAASDSINSVNASVTLQTNPVIVTPSDSEFLILSDTTLDGATWYRCNHVFWANWNNLGGDWRDSTESAQGLTPYAQLSISTTGVKTISITALAQKWVTDENTGLHLRTLSGPTVNIRSRDAPTGTPPSVSITTTTGTFNCPALATVWIHSSSSSVIQSSSQGYIVKPTALMRFDLSAVTGTVTSATLTLEVTTIFAGTLPAVLAINRLEPLRIVTNPADQIGGVVYGIANDVETSDLDLASDVRVLTYDDLSSESYINTYYLTTAPTSVGGMTFELDETYGFTWANCYSGYGPGTQRVITWHKLTQPINAAPPALSGASWRRAYDYNASLGYDEMYCRFMMKIGSDLRDAFNENGLKLPGMAGVYSYSTSGAVTLPEPGIDNTWEARLFLRTKSNQHPQIYIGGTYWYGADHSYADFPANGDIRNFNLVPFYFAADRAYSCEQYIKVNTQTAGVWNTDGIYRVWIDGVLVHEQTNLLIRSHQAAQVHEIPWFNVYHGGLGNPLSSFHVSLASSVSSLQYIGPPKIPDSLPAWVPAPGYFQQFTLNTPASVGANAGVFADWCGGTFIADYGTQGAVAYHGGREHGAGWSTNAQQAVYLLDCSTRLYLRKCYPEQANVQGSTDINPSPPPPLVYSGTPNDDWGAYTDGSPGTMHTYGGLCEMPTAWGGGSSSSLVRVAQSAGVSKTKVDAGAASSGVAESDAATWRFDLSKDTHTLANPAMSRLTGSSTYHYIASSPSTIATVSDAPTCCADTIRQGWWSFQRTSSGNRGLSFTSKTGVISNFAAPGIALAFWSKMYHFADDDVLCIICDEPTFGTQLFGTVKLLNMSSLPGGSWVNATVSRPSDPAMTWGGPSGISAGYMGPQWSSILNCFVGLDTKTPETSSTTIRVWKLTPPPVGQRFTGTWVWSVETVTSSDGSVMNVRTDPSSMNGSWGKLVECPTLRSLVWTRGSASVGQLIRLQGM